MIMTPKEKALELFYKFNKVTSKEFNSDTFTSATSAKKCALIAVDEIISQLQCVSDFESSIFIDNEYISVIELIEYWEEVKKEIENI